MMIRGKKILKISARILLWLTGIFMCLFGALWLILKVPSVQNFLVSKATSYVSGKTHTRVELQHIDIGFPKSILLQGLFLEDTQHDTLASLNELEIDLNMLALLNKTISVQKLELDQPYVRLRRPATDSSFNFQFLIDAFSSDNKKQIVTDTSASAPWTIKANSIALKNCRFDMADSLSGLIMLVRAGTIEAELNKLDLENDIVDLGNITLADAHGSMRNTKAGTTNTDTTSSGWNGIDLSTLSIKRSSFTYSDVPSSMLVAARIGELTLESTTLNLSKQSIKSDGLTITQSSSIVQLKADKTKTTHTINTQQASDVGWSIELASLEMKQDAFQMDIINEKKITSGIDWNHLKMYSITTSTKDIVYTTSLTKASIKSLSAQDKSGFSIHSLQANAYMNDTKAELTDLALVTNHSYIGQSIKIGYKSMNEMLSSLSLNCSMSENKIAIKELLFFVPDLDTIEIIHKNRDRVIEFNLNANGSLNKLNVKEFIVKTLNTSINVNGVLKSLTDPDKLFMDLHFKRIQTGAGDLAAILPDSTLPSAIRIPSEIYLKGNYKGTLSTFKSAIDMSSSIGGAFVHADIKDLKKETPSYKLALQTHHFDLGKLLDQEILGQLNGTIDVQGSGLNKETADATLAANLESMKINSYNYHNITLDGTINNGLVTAKGAVADSNLVLAYDAKVNLNKDQEYYDLQAMLKGADFYGLGLSKDHISLSANADIHLTGDPTENIDGHIASRDILVIKDGKKYKTDSLVFISVNEPGKSSMKLNSSMFAASFDGNIDILSIAPALTNHFNRYMQLTDAKFKETKPQNFAFEIQLNDSPLLREVILPSLTSYNPMHIKGAFNSAEANLTINAEIPFATYADMTVNAFTFTLNSDPKTLSYDTGWDYFKTPQVSLKQTTLNGKIANDTAGINLQISNAEKEEKLKLHTNLTLASQNRYRFSILKDGLVLEGKNWDVSENNFIEFAKGYVFADQLKLTQGKQSISLQSSNEGEDMALRFSTFDLHTLSQIAEDDTMMFQGILDGDIQLKDFLHNPAFTSELKIQHLAYKQSTIGNLHITADNLTADRYTAKVILTDSTNKATISGYYLSNKEESALNFNADIESIDLLSLEAFSQGQITGSSGLVKGNIAITGALKDPKFNGKIQFIDASTKVSFMNQRLFMKKETITISPEKVVFNSFNIKDSLNNEAVINGSAGIEDFNNVTFNLAVTTKNFMVLNTTAVNNKLYYGKVILDSKISVKGDQNLPVIKADIDIVRGSHFTYAIPESQVSIDRGDGIVIFTSDSSSLDPIMLRDQENQSANKITGLDISAKVSINRNSTLKVLVDPISGDSLSVKGDADLNFKMDPSGQMSLSGRYILSEGTYKASLENLIVRKFDITKGSSIIWSGDIMDALVDINATYKTKTAPDGLLVNTVVVDSSALRKPLPFIVIMSMQGELLKPVISFQLDMPDNMKGALGGEVYSQLTAINGNESEVNKQVFALLVMNRFIAPDNTNGGNDASAFARRSVSRMMSNELNKISAKYVNGVQIDVDVQSYNQVNSGQQQGNTQVEVGVTKSLLNERLSVQVGGNIAVEGQDANTASNAKNLTGDVTVEYKLTKNGRYRVRAFRVNQYDGISNGTIVETGAGLGYVRNYTHTKELFTSKRKKKKKQASE